MSEQQITPCTNDEYLAAVRDRMKQIPSVTSSGIGYIAKQYLISFLTL